MSIVLTVILIVLTVILKWIFFKCFRFTIKQEIKRVLQSNAYSTPVESSVFREEKEKTEQF